MWAKGKAYTLLKLREVLAGTRPTAATVHLQRYTLGPAIAPISRGI